MTRLKCGVQNCAYNSSRLCSLNEISVEGYYADQPRATMCGSFRENDGSATNSIERSASLDTFVACSAEHCQHNKECQCHADTIDISGDRAHNPDNTQCSTFESRI